MESLARRIRALPSSCGTVRLVAIDGPAGSGKTTYAGALAATLGCQAVHADDFPVPWHEGPATWFGALFDQVLEPLRQGRPGGFRRYDWVRGAYAEQVAVPVAPVLIIEGVGTARESAAHLLACVIWLEAPDDVRLRRVLDRDGPGLEERWREWFDAERDWFAADDTRARADLIVSTAPAGGRSR